MPLTLQPSYRGMDRAALDVAYNNRAVVPDWEGYLARWQARSTALYAKAAVRRDLRYGGGPRQRFDVFSCGRDHAPAVLFLHGGYWQWNDKEGQAFIAEGLLPHGVDVVIGEYTLAPRADMAAICAEVRALVRHLMQHGGACGLGGGGLFVSGISTGAHLVALTLGEPAVRGALLISGIYDLEPIRLSSLNEAIGMDEDDAYADSPLHQLPVACGPVVVAFGADERPEIQRQGSDYAAALAAAGRGVERLAVPQADHFSVLESLADSAGILARRLADMAHASGPAR